MSHTASKLATYVHSEPDGMLCTIQGLLQCLCLICVVNYEEH